MRPDQQLKTGCPGSTSAASQRCRNVLPKGSPSFLLGALTEATSLACTSSGSSEGSPKRSRSSDFTTQASLVACSGPCCSAFCGSSSGGRSEAMHVCEPPSLVGWSSSPQPARRRAASSSAGLPEQVLGSIPWLHTLDAHPTQCQPGCQPGIARAWRTSRM